MFKSTSHLHSAEWRKKKKHSNAERAKELLHIRAELKRLEEEEKKKEEAEE